jgi:hypothetical protein
MKLALLKASTDVTLNIFIQDSRSATGAGLTGLVYNTSSLVCYYARERAAAAALSLATQTTTGAHSDGGFVEIDATNMPGAYRLDLSDAICATGVNSALVMLKGAANMVPLVIEIQLTSFDLNDADPDVNLTKIAGTAVSTTTAQLGVNAVNIGGTAQTGRDIGASVLLAASQLFIKKNAALANFEFLMLDSTDHVTPKTGLTITAQRSIDGAAFGACANAASELANGIYVINLAAADLNGTVITLKFTATGADATYITLITQT